MSDTQTILVKVKVKPGSKIERVFYDDQKVLNIAIKQHAIEGRANKELLKVMGKFFKISSSEISFKSGTKSKLKTLRIDSDDETISACQRMLGQLGEGSSK